MRNFLTSENAKIVDAAFLRAAYGVLNNEKDFDLEELVAIDSEKTFKSMVQILQRYNKTENLGMFEFFLAIVQRPQYQNKKEVFRALLKVYTNTKFLQKPTNYAIVHDYVYDAEDKIELLFERAREQSIQPMIIEILPKAGKALGSAVLKSIEGYSNNVSLEIINEAIEYLDGNVLLKIIIRNNLDGDISLRQGIIEKIIKKYPLIAKSTGSYLLDVVFNEEFNRAFRLELLQKILKYKLSKDSLTVLQKKLGQFLEKADFSKEWPILEQAFTDYLQMYGDEEDILYAIDNAAKERAGYRIFDNFGWLCNDSYAKFNGQMIAFEITLLRRMLYQEKLKTFENSLQASCLVLMVIAEISLEEQADCLLILEGLMDDYANEVYQLVDFINDENRNYIATWLNKMIVFCDDHESRKIIIKFCLDNQLGVAELKQKYSVAVAAINEEYFEKEYEKEALEILRLP